MVCKLNNKSSYLYIKNCIELLNILILLLIFFSKVLSATPMEEFKQLKTQYLKLRNTDSYIKNIDRWITVGSKLEEFANTLSSQEASNSLFDAGKIYQTIYEVKGIKEYFVKSSDCYLAIPNRFPDSTTAPTAYKTLYDLWSKEDPLKAQEFLKTLLNKYPKSEYTDFAKLKLASYEKESNKKSNTDESQLDLSAAKVVVLDPGHGGEDFGAIGVSGLLEKDVTLEVAFNAKEILQKMGYKVVLTRVTDDLVPLQRRTDIANEQQADIFVSIHCNASEKGNVSGFEIYTLDTSNDKSAKTLADRENQTKNDDEDSQDLSFMLSDLIQTTKSPDSIKLADSIQEEVKNKIPTYYPAIKVLKSKKAPFYVLVGAHMPSVLVELLFINHPIDGQKLIDKSFRENMALAISNGIKSYFTH